MTSSMESNWMKELGTLQCLGEEIILLYTIFYDEELSLALSLNNCS